MWDAQVDGSLVLSHNPLTDLLNFRINRTLTIDSFASGVHMT